MTTTDTAFGTAELRSRAAVLRALAASIDAGPGRWLRELTRPGDACEPCVGSDRREVLRRSVLATNLHQLHRAADDLRVQAFELDAVATAVDRSSDVRSDGGEPSPPPETAARCLELLAALAGTDATAQRALRIARLVALNIETLGAAGAAD